MRTLSANFRHAMFGASDSQVVLTLLTLQSAGLSEPLRFANDMNAQGHVVSRGEVYTCLPFRVALGADDADRPARARLEMDNIGAGLAGGSAVVAALRKLLAMGDVRATFELVLAVSPDVVELGPVRAAMQSAEYDLGVITATLGPDAALEERWPYERFTPSSHGALF